MHRKVRLECVEYLREHRQDFQDFVALPDGQTFDDYLRAMSLVRPDLHPKILGLEQRLISLLGYLLGWSNRASSVIAFV